MEAVYASGILRTADQYRVFSPVQGILTRMYVSVGDSIRSGTVVFEVKSDDPLVRLRSAEETLYKSHDRRTYDNAAIRSPGRTS